MFWLEKRFKQRVLPGSAISKRCIPFHQVLLSLLHYVDVLCELLYKQLYNLYLYHLCAYKDKFGRKLLNINVPPSHMACFFPSRECFCRILTFYPDPHSSIGLELSCGVLLLFPANLVHRKDSMEWFGWKGP